jgi:hypothetical protein
VVAGCLPYFEATSAVNFCDDKFWGAVDAQVIAVPRNGRGRNPGHMTFHRQGGIFQNVNRLEIFCEIWGQNLLVCF